MSAYGQKASGSSGPEQFGVRVPRALPEHQVTFQGLDMNRLADLPHVDHVRRVVPLPLGSSDGARVLGPPLVVLKVSAVRRDLSGDCASVLQERITLVGAGGLNPVAQPEVADGTRELGLPVGLGADEDGRLLVNADAQRILTHDAVPGGVDLGRDAVLGLTADGNAVDAEVDVRTAHWVDSRREQGGHPVRVGSVGDV